MPKHAIHKYELPVPLDPVSMISTVMMPLGAKILDIRDQFDAPFIWALIDPQAALSERRFLVIPTGAKFDLNASAKHVGTFQLAGGALIFHVFETI